MSDDAKDAARYRWLNQQHHFMIYIEGPETDPTRSNLRLRCGESLNGWLDKRIEEDKLSYAAAVSRQEEK